MNKKIFTLLVGAIMIFGSAFTVNAQVLPYSSKIANGVVNFRDILTADTVKRLYDNNDSYYYLLSVTGIANDNGTGLAQELLGNAGIPPTSRELSYVLTIDDYNKSATNPLRYLRLENLATLDTAYAYTWRSETTTAAAGIVSHKFGALRHALWCVRYNVNGVAGSNIIYDFANMETGRDLAAPYYENAYASRWERASDNNRIYKDSINMYGNNLVSGWHFSQTYSSNQDLQTGMPLYSYISNDTVAVLVLADAETYDTPYIPGQPALTNLENATTGGYKVTVKNVAISDLVVDAIGNVKIGSGNGYVDNVLLFTLKKVNRFVMNAHDWNAFGRADITFNPDNANTPVTNGSWKYVNPFTDSDIARLNAVEVNDSLYHYGYMQFESTGTGTNAPPAGKKYLYVDTAFANYGNNQYLAFGWSARRDSTALMQTGSMGWGSTFVSLRNNAAYNGKKPVQSDYLLRGVYWRLDSLIWATIKKAMDYTVITLGLGSAIDYTHILEMAPTPGALANWTSPLQDLYLNGAALNSDATLWDEIVQEADACGVDVSAILANTNYSTLIGGGLTAGTDYSILDAAATSPAYYNGIFGIWKVNEYYYPRVGFNANTPLTHAAYAEAITLLNTYEADSINFVYAYMRDSIMENQSKFRVVYDPTYDSTFINVYQTRVQYPDYRLGVQNATKPYWWENSFGERTFTMTTPVAISHKFLLRPSDLYTRTPYGGFPTGFTVPPAIGTQSIEFAAWEYYDRVARFVTSSNGIVALWAYPAGALNWNLEGHGVAPSGVTDGSRDVNNPSNANIHNFHSFMDFFPQSTLANMDRVLISTADTCRLYELTYGQAPTVPLTPTSVINYSGLSHIYGWSTTTPGGTLYYRDSLFYVDLQDLSTSSKIITLDQSYKQGKKLLDRRIRLLFGKKCEPPTVDTIKDVKIEDDLYLIRNTDGQYLCVPIWSITDSIFWVTPAENEDPTKMPCYQWIVKGIPNTFAFTLQNREFAYVNIPYATLSSTIAPGSVFGLTSPYSAATFNKRNVIGKATSKAEALQQNASFYTANTFVRDLEIKFPVNTYSFIRLGNSVKGDNLIGYKYIDKDSTFIDVYAFKFYHFLAPGPNAPHLSWKGYYSNDTTLYADGTTYYDKLYFMLQEMEYDMIDSKHLVILTDANTKSNQQYRQYRGVYDKIAKQQRHYTYTDGIVLERFGYVPALTNDIEGLVPTVRQAYRLFLQDYYRWHPTLKGHYVTVGQQDRYILADKIYALNPYKRGQDKIEGLFGIPHFYFRNTYFDLTKKGDDYFGIVQRIDTARIDANNTNYFNSSQALWGVPQYGDIADYMERIYDTYVAQILLKQIQDNREYSLALLDIQHTPEAKAKFVIRGDAFVNSNISAFQLVRDEDPIYRRFRNNEPDPWYPRTDKPDTLEFHFMNQGEGGVRLYENSGNYLSPDQNDYYGEDGGRPFNRDGVGKPYYKDTLDNVISFLGDNNSYSYKNTNYAFFVDTAFINRGTGWIKPQYLIAVDPYNPVEIGDCDPTTGEAATSPNSSYVIARYMFNTSQYAKEVKDSVQMGTASNWVKTNDHKYTQPSTTLTGFYFTKQNFSKVEPIKDAVMRNPNGKAYTFDGKWERFAFTWAIHYGDKLYVLKGLEPGYRGNTNTDRIEVFNTLLADYGNNIGSSKGKFINFARLESDNIVKNTSYTEAYYLNGDLGPGEVRTYNQFRSMEAVRAAGQSIGLQAIIDLGDNTHKDWVYSFRYIERHASDFVIESETTDRNTFYGAMIRPGYGGWLKSQNGVPVITRSDLKDNMGQAAGSVLNVKLANNPVNNEVLDAAGAELQVVGGVGAVTIFNAAGKKVVISNMLGQTIAKTTLNSDNASIAAPAGVVVVAVEGESAAKVIVK